MTDKMQIPTTDDFRRLEAYAVQIKRIVGALVQQVPHTVEIRDHPEMAGSFNLIVGVPYCPGVPETIKHMTGDDGVIRPIGGVRIHGILFYGEIR